MKNSNWEKKMQYTKIALMIIGGITIITLLVKIESNTRKCVDNTCVIYERINTSK